MASDKPITIVTGLPRSGTSLVMQMLTAGGMESSPGTVPPLYEDIGTINVAECRGRCVKALSVHSKPIPNQGTDLYRFIIMHRDPKQQSLSWMKIQGLLCGPRPEVLRLRLEVSLVVEWYTLHDYVVDNYDANPLVLNFEEIITEPYYGACHIERWMGRPNRPLARHRMAHAVASRSPDNFNGFMEVGIEDEITRQLEHAKT